MASSIQQTFHSRGRSEDRRQDEAVHDGGRETYANEVKMMMRNSPASGRIYSGEARAPGRPWRAARSDTGNLMRQ